MDTEGNGWEASKVEGASFCGEGLATEMPWPFKSTGEAAALTGCTAGGVTLRGIYGAFFLTRDAWGGANSMVCTAMQPCRSRLAVSLESTLKPVGKAIDLCRSCFPKVVLVK